MTLHDGLIRDVLKEYPKARAKGFRQAVIDAIPSFEDDETPLRTIVPDAYIVDEEAREIVVFEAENTSKLTRRKLEAYSLLWWMLDDEEWLLRLIAVDIYGVRREVAMMTYAYGWLFEEGLTTPKRLLTLCPNCQNHHFPYLNMDLA